MELGAAPYRAVDKHMIWQRTWRDPKTLRLVGTLKAGIQTLDIELWWGELLTVYSPWERPLEVIDVDR